MDPAQNQTLLTLAFLAGPVIIGAAVLWYGVSKVQSTAGVLACAVVATLLFAAALGLLFLLTALSFNGGDRARWLLMVGLFAAPAAVIAFLTYKLPRTWGKPR